MMSTGRRGPDGHSAGGKQVEGQSQVGWGVKMGQRRQIQACARR